MGIPKVQEHKERPLGVILDPGHGVGKSIVRPPLDGLKPIFTFPLAMKPCTVNVKTTLEPRREAVLGVQNNRADKRARSVAARLQQRR